MDIKINLTALESQALLDFIEEYIDKDHLPLSVFSSAFSRSLFLAYLKIRKAKEEWDEKMAYTE